LKETFEATVRVVYVTGAGHIGSTILDIVLGNHPHIQGVGEVSKVHRSGWVSDTRRRCACGALVPDCTFWPQVRARWARSVGGDDVARYVHLQGLFERYRTAWPRLLANRFRPSPEFREYSRKTQALYEAVREVSGRAVIVDSSLTPRRAYALTLNPDIDLSLIHLVRDGRGVIWSLMKPNKKTLTKVYKPAPSWRTTKYWISANLQSTWVFHRLPKEKRQRVRYEDFVTDPAMILKRIGTLLGEDMSSLAHDVATQQPIQAGHTVGGSSVRMAQGIRVRPDFAWQDRLPAKDRRVFWLLAGWLAQRYGYTQQPT
jgi:hypothetical protein